MERQLFSVTQRQTPMCKTGRLWRGSQVTMQLDSVVIVGAWHLRKCAVVKCKWVLWDISERFVDDMPRPITWHRLQRPPYSVSHVASDRLHFHWFTVGLLQWYRLPVGISLSSQKHEVTYDFIVVHIEATQKSFGDKPKCVYIFLQTPMMKSTRGNRIFLNNSANTHPNVTNEVSIPMFSGSRIMITLFLLWLESSRCHKYANLYAYHRLILSRSVFF